MALRGKVRLQQQKRNGSGNSVMHTENVARGANWEFPKCKGGQGVYNVLTFQV